MNFSRQTDGGLFLPDKRLLMPKHHGSRYAGVIAGPGASGGTPEAPFDGLLRADYQSGADLTVYGGSPTGTLNNATVHDGGLDLDTGAFAVNTYCEYAAASNWRPTSVFTVNVLFVPGYSGTPTSNVYLWANTRNADTRNGVVLQHKQTTGNLELFVRSANGLDSDTMSFGAWSPTAGVEYEIEINYDGATGESRCFVDGTQQGSTLTDTNALDPVNATANFIRLGAGANPGSNHAYHTINDFKVWETIQHTADY